jgi:hypothetical protein
MLGKSSYAVAKTLRPAIPGVADVVERRLCDVRVAAYPRRMDDVVLPRETALGLVAGRPGALFGLATARLRSLE